MGTGEKKYFKIKSMQFNHHMSRVLLIENDTDDCEVFGWAIKDISEDFKLECCNDSTQAAQKIKEFHPDIIFLDIKLPRKNGLEFMEELQATGTLSGIPIVIYSSYIYPVDVKEAARLGAKIYFEKPHSYSDLVEGLRDILCSRSWEGATFEPRFLRDGAFHPIL